MLTRRTFIQFFVAVTVSGWLALAAHAQPMLINPALSNSPVEPGAPPPPPQTPSVADKRSENAEQLHLAMRKLDANGANDTAAAQEVAFHQTRDAVLTQQDAVEQQVNDLNARKAEMEKQLNSPPPADKQYTFADLDRIKDEIAAAVARANLVDDKLTTSETNLQKATTALAEAEVKRRQAQTAYDNNKNAPNAAELAVAANRAKQDAALAGETLALRKREVDREELAKEILKLAIKVRRDQIAKISSQVKFTDADYQEQIASVKKSEESATAALSNAQANQQSAETELRNFQKQLDVAPDDAKTVLTEVVAARRRTRDKCCEEIESAQQQLQQLAQVRLAWSHRYELANSNAENADHETWAKWKQVQKDTQEILDALAADLRNQIFKMREVRSTLSFVNKKADAAANGPPEITMAFTTQQQRLEETLKIYEKNLVRIENSRRVHEKLLDEIGVQVETLSPKSIALGVWYQADLVWKTELLEMGGKSIDVGMAVKALTILIIGSMFSRFTSGFFANRFLKRFRLSKDATSAIRSLVFYSLLAFVALTALNTINVPLTAFTILGGGLAIGVGFGSQTLINNFIGGLIMLAERPVRLGERITFKDMDGVVEDVGFRCTKLRTPTDHLVTIPNSTLVNESIENIDRRRTIRRSFTVAVTYNISHDRLAEGVQAIRDVLEERDIRERIHPIVGFEELSPKVHFSDFAAESLNIKIDYWYAPVDSSAFNEHSERVNFRIMEEFDRLGIDFAFPSKTPYVKNQKNMGGGRSRGDSYAA
jgi:potassium-dependent mechanosensitive channel